MSDAVELPKVAADQPIGRFDQLLGQIGQLALLKRGLGAYYQSLLRESDEVLRCAALCALLELGAIYPEQAELVIAHAHWGGVKRRGFSFFVSMFEYEIAESIAATPAEDVDTLVTAHMRAELDRNYKEMAALDRQLFLAHGTPDFLWAVEINEERAGGWLAAFPAAIASMLARPMDPNGPFPALDLLLNANQLELLARFCAAFSAAQIYPVEVGLFEAAILNTRGEYKQAMTRLQRLPAVPSDKLNSMLFRVRAEAFEGLGEFRQAYTAHQRHNALGKPANIDPRQFYQGVTRRAQMKIEPVPPDSRIERNLMLVGFARSGTTLLENALSVHPQIETLEEIPATSRMSRALDRLAPPSGEVSAELAVQVRERYFDEIARQRRKPEASYVIDKMPMLAAEAGYLERMFPGRKYIFAVRHPQDVVLSCFRQSFGPNAAMENLRSIEDAAALYDFTMSQWFDVHSLDDPRVSYVRYEDVVQAFRPTLERVLGFIGVGWDDALLNFVEAADRRSVKTPSYRKVRSGLGIGVQSARENYRFAFEGKNAARLQRWIEHFGYSS